MSERPSVTRTPLAIVRGLGSAKSGTHVFWHERLTGVALVPLTLAMVGIVLAAMHKDYNAVHALMAGPLVAILVAGFIVASVYHMQMGMQVIIEDYVHAPLAKITALMANTLFSLLIGLACLYAALKISFA